MKKQSTKKVLALATSAAMMLTAFTACGSSQAPSTTPTQQTSEAQSEEAKDDSTNGDTVTINFWHHYSAQSAENETLMNVLIPKFEEENPGYKVNAVSHDWSDFMTRF